LDSLAPDRKLLRVFDLAALALRALAAERPVVILIDDLQWADEDSLRMLRYVVRVDASSPILLVLAMRPAGTAFVDEAVTLLADMERMGLLRRLKLGRLGQHESTELLQQVLGGRVGTCKRSRGGSKRTYAKSIRWPNLWHRPLQPGCSFSSRMALQRTTASRTIRSGNMR